MYDVRKGSIFILWHVAIQFYQHHLLKKPLIASFPHCVLLASLPNISWPYMCGFVSGLFFSIGLYVCFYASIILFCLLHYYNIFWNQKMWCFHLCSSCSKLLWLFRVFCGSTQILEFCFFCKKHHWEFDKDCINM